MNNNRNRLLALFLAFVLAVGSVTGFSVEALGNEINNFGFEAHLEEHEDLITLAPRSGDSVFPSQHSALTEREQAELAVLTGTLGEPIGMRGFEGIYALDDSNAIIEIVVQFRTPPSVALRLSQERGIAHGRTITSASYEEQALSAHDAFREQLGRLPMPLGDSPFEIFGESYSLFNGVFMRVPSNMVELIEGLPEVYGVFPNINFQAMGFVPTPAPMVINNAFMLQTRQLFNTDYIHNTMGFTGAGITVAVIDSGIYHNHPEFASFRRPEYGNRVPGWDFIHNNNNPAERPGEVDFGHGTHVAGTIIAIAPDVNLRAYRVLGQGGFYFTQYISAIQAAHQSSDVINFSIHWDDSQLFSTINHALNLAALDGVVTVVIAGNFGNNRTPYTLSQFAQAGLPIVVANGTAGGNQTGQFGDNISTVIVSPQNRGSSHGPVTEIHHIKPDITAPGTGIMSTLPSGLGLYDAWTGTSMAGPSISGVAALMLQAFPNAEHIEIKARLMNTARPLANLNPRSVFATGAGFVQPIEALQSSTFVTVEHGIPWGNHWGNTGNFVPHTMSSLSFGVVGAMTNNLSTMVATINNTSNTSLTYDIYYMFLNNPNNAALVTLSRRTITVPPQSSANFTVSISLRDTVSAGFYEGYIYVRESSNQVARLPFAMVNPGPGAVTVPANQLNFNLGGNLTHPTVPLTIDSINVNNGTLLENFLTNRHDGFTYSYGGFPTDGPTRNEYAFLGWYTTANFAEGTRLTATTVMPATETTLFARWGRYFELSFNLGSTVPHPTTPLTIAPIQVRGTGVISTHSNFPSDPIRQGHTFEGWYFDSAFALLLEATSVMPETNTTLYARWSSSDATLDVLTADGYNALPDAAPPLPGFAHDIDNDTTSVTIVATPNCSEATVAITAPSTVTVTGGVVSNLPEGSTDITITVTAEDGTERVYTITITREALAPSIAVTTGIFDLDAPADVTFTVNLGTGSLAATAVSNVTGNGITATDWSFTGTTLTINSTFLSTLAEGTASFNVIFNDTAGTSIPVTIEIEDGYVGTAPSIAVTTGIFDLDAPANVTFTVNLGTGPLVATAVSNVTGNGITATDWSFTGTTLTINSTFLSTLAEGTASFNVIFNDTAGTSIPVTIEIEDGFVATLTLTPTTVAVNDVDLIVTLDVGGTATGAITLGPVPAPVSSVITMAESGGVITITGVRPAIGQPDIIGFGFTVAVTRQGLSETFTVNVNLTALSAAPTLTLTPTTITVNDADLIVTSDVGGTAGGVITLVDTLPAGVTVAESGGAITVTGVRPATGQPDIVGSYTVTVTRQGISETLTVNVNLTALPSVPTLALIPATITVNDANLVVTSDVGGTAGGMITLADTLPAGVTVAVAGDVVTVTGIRPATGQPDIMGSYTVTVTRQGLSETLTVNVNLTALPVVPTLTLTPATITVNDANLVVTSDVGGTATGAITLVDTLPAGVTVAEVGGVITVTGVRPAVGQPDIVGNYTVTVTRQGLSEMLMVNVNLTALPAVATLTLTPTTIDVNDANLIVTSDVGGTATGIITLADTLPTGVTVAVAGDVVTVTGVRPATGQPAIVGSFTVIITRQGISETLTVNVNLTALPAVPTLALTPATVIINDANLIVTSDVGGTAGGIIALLDTLPAGVAVAEADGIITVTGVRPATGQPDIVGSYTVTVTRQGISEVLTVNVNLTAIPELFVAIELNPSDDHTFPSEYLGYTIVSTHQVQITNVGTMETGALVVLLSGESPDSFMITPSTFPNILPGQSATFEISPLVGLDIGEYSAIVTVASAIESGSWPFIEMTSTSPAALTFAIPLETSTFAAQSFEVSFEVEQPNLVNLAFNPNGGVLRGITGVTTLPAILQGSSLRANGVASFAQADLIPTRSNFRFDGWFMDNGDAFTIDTAIINDIIVTARWTQITTQQPPHQTPSTPSGGDSDDRSPPPPPPPLPLLIPVNDGSLYVTASRSNHRITLQLPTHRVNEIIQDSDGVTIFDLSNLRGATIVTFPRTALRRFAEAELAIEFQFPQGNVIFDAISTNSIGQLARTTNVSVSLSEIGTTDLSEVQQMALPVNGIALYVVTIPSGVQQIDSAFDGEVSISLPYSGELPVAVWFLTDEGVLIRLESAFDEDAKIITFVTTQLGVFVVGYDEGDDEPPSDEVIETEPELPQIESPRTIRFTIGNTLYTIDNIVRMNDVAPFIDPAYDRTMIPLRAVAEALNAEVDWLEETRTVVIFTATGTLTLVIDAPLPYNMGVPVIRDGRTFVPLRYVAEMLDATVRWDGENMAVYVYQYNTPNPSSSNLSVPSWFVID